MSAPILDASAIASRMTTPATDPRAYLLAFYPRLTVPPMEHRVLTARPMIARINHGLWIASCECGARGAPAPGCVVWLDQPMGWCVRCQNGATGRGWRPVALPDLPVRQAIESVLMCRPNIADRNWEPGETIADLIAQNREHDDPVMRGL